MKEFFIPLLPITLEKNTDDKMNDRDVPGIQLESPWTGYQGRPLFTGVFAAGGKDGLAFSFCGEVPRDKLVARRTEPHTKVYEDDCYEVFILPGEPDKQTVYYAWEINPNGACLDYRVFTDATAAKENISPDAPEYDGGEQVTGVFEDTVAGVPLVFDYSWKTNAQWRIQTEDEFWYMELFIPWKDLGVKEQPLPGTTWKVTINRIDAGARSRAVSGENRTENPGLQCLLEDTDIPAFHQPAKFAAFHFTTQEQ